jgi:hypothetical protein
MQKSQCIMGRGKKLDPDRGGNWPQAIGFHDDEDVDSITNKESKKLFPILNRLLKENDEGWFQIINHGAAWFLNFNSRV